MFFNICKHFFINRKDCSKHHRQLLLQTVFQILWNFLVRNNHKFLLIYCALNQIYDACALIFLHIVIGDLNEKLHFVCYN
jgi:hypothetical protein